MTIGTGKLDKRIAILKRQLVDDGYQTKEQWSELRKVWANVTFVSDRERLYADSIQRNVQVRFIIRTTDPEIDNTYRIRYKNKTYGIDGSKPIDRFMTEITAGEVNEG